MRYIPTLALILCAAAATAGEPNFVDQRGDTYRLTRESDSVAVVEYHNSVAKQSPGMTVTLSDQGLEVTIDTEVNSGRDDNERITVHAPEGWVVDPPHLDVRDGATGTVILYRGTVGM